MTRANQVLAPAVTRLLLDRYAKRLPPLKPAKEPSFPMLTERDLMVLRLVARGLSNAQIGADLHLADSNVKTHVSHIRARFGTARRVQLVLLAYETGLVQPNSIWAPSSSSFREGVATPGKL